MCWLRFVGLPFLRRNEEDIRLLLKDFLPIYRLEPMNNSMILLEGHKVLTLLDATKPIPYGINIDEEGV